MRARTQGMYESKNEKNENPRMWKDTKKTGKQSTRIFVIDVTGSKQAKRKNTSNKEGENPNKQTKRKNAS